jgi:hypothetical protein
VWRGAYSQGEAEAQFESTAEYAAGGGRGGYGGGGRVGALAARAALSGLPAAGVPLAQLAIHRPDRGFIDGEFEDELEAAGLHPEMLMEHFGHAAAMAENEAEAEAFILPLLPLAAKFLLPRVGSMVMRRVAPQLTRGAIRVARTLRRNPQTRPLVRLLPTIVRRTVRDIAGQVERGRPVTTQGAVRYLARETRRVLDDPQARRHAYRRSRRLDRRYHDICGEIHT